MTIVAVATFAISGLTTYMAAFGLDGLARGTLSPDAPREPLSFLRAVDPDADIVTNVESINDLQDELDTPGMSVLLERMTREERLFMVMPLGAVTSDPRVFPQPALSGEVVVASDPPFLSDSPVAADRASLWGHVTPLPGIDDRSVGPVAVRRVDEEPPERGYIAGNGYRSQTGRQELLLLSPRQADELGVYLSYSAADLMEYVTCYCTVDDLAPLAADMTEEEQRSRSGRIFYAISYEGLIGPSERSLAVTAVLLAVFPAATGLSVVVFAATATLLLWRRRERDYAVERHCGAGEVGLQFRQQIITALAITAPALVAFLLVDAFIQNSQPPPPWPPSGGPVIPLLAVILQAAVGAGIAFRVHLLCRPRSSGGRLA